MDEIQDLFATPEDREYAAVVGRVARVGRVPIILIQDNDEHLELFHYLESARSQSLNSIAREEMDKLEQKARDIYASGEGWWYFDVIYRQAKAIVAAPHPRTHDDLANTMLKAGLFRIVQHPDDDFIGDAKPPADETTWAQIIKALCGRGT